MLADAGFHLIRDAAAFHHVRKGLLQARNRAPDGFKRIALREL